MSRTRPLGLIALATLFVSGWGGTASGQPTQPQPPPPPPLIPVAPSVGPALPQLVPQAVPPMAPGMPPRFPCAIDPKTPAKELLPPAPRTSAAPGPVTGDDLARVPEASLGVGAAPGPDAAKDTAHQVAKAAHLNTRQRDGFLAALREARPDLAGLPFVMGDECRTTGKHTQQFTTAVATIRQIMNGANVPQLAGSVHRGFWEQFQLTCDQQDAGVPKADREIAAAARVAALMQVLGTDETGGRPGLVKYLAGVTHREATRALARLAVYAAEDDVRTAAIEALKVRREKDYTDLLLAGLQYPLPAAAGRAAEAIAKLERNDLLPDLLAVLETEDPRTPVTRGGKTTIREVVRVNHHKSCLLCHAPGSHETVSSDVLTAPIPVPGQPLNPPTQGYNSQQASPDLMIRIDVTYLRQDFSALLPVAEAQPWPSFQRFDFLVRRRELTDEEAEAYREKLAVRGKGAVSPYQRAVLSALREMTGKDAAPTAAAWREVLDLPAKAGKSR